MGWEEGICSRKQDVTVWMEMAEENGSDGVGEEGEVGGGVAAFRRVGYGGVPF